MREYREANVQMFNSVNTIKINPGSKKTQQLQHAFVKHYANDDKNVRKRYF